MSILPPVGSFSLLFQPQTTSFFNIQDNFDNLCLQLNLFHWLGGILDAFIFLKLLTTFCPLFFTPKPPTFSTFMSILPPICPISLFFSAPNQQHFHYLCWFSKSQLVTWTFPLIWWNSGHSNFRVNLAPICPFSFLFSPLTTTIFNIQDNFLNLFWQRNLYHWFGAVLEAFIFMKIFTIFCPLFSCLWLRNHQNFQQSSWFSKSLLLTWPFPLIWWNSWHINFHVNLPPVCSFQCFFHPKPPAFSTYKLIFIIFVGDLIFSIDLVEFWTH